MNPKTRPLVLYLVTSRINDIVPYSRFVDCRWIESEIEFDKSLKTASERGSQ
jgi:hypothetical protein